MNISHHAKKVLIIGFGSIGKRHANVLKQLNYSIYLITQQKTDEFISYRFISEAFLHNNYDYIVIANATYLHDETLKQVLSYHAKGAILVEKPLFSSKRTLTSPNDVPIYVGYNLRFHPIIQRLKSILMGQKIISFLVRVGQYLPIWRSDTDYRRSYSSKKSLGGGVLRDLSHELDYSTWICGDCVEVTALGGKFSQLEIDSDDTYSILMRCQRAKSVSIHMDYLSRILRREIIVQTNEHTYFADMIQHTLSIDGNIENFSVINTYEKQHQSILQNDHTNLCHYSDGLKVVHLIDKIEEANLKKQWIFI